MCPVPLCFLLPAVSLELSFVPSEIANEKVFSRELSGKTKENHLREYFGKPVAAG